MTQPTTPIKPPRPPWFLLVFISMFGCIGLALLVFLWSKSSHDWDAPPLIFRVVGSCIAIAFIAMGFGIPLSAWRRLRSLSPLAEDGAGGDALGVPSRTGPSAGYQCPHCAAGLTKAQEVSPSGDVKCVYCQKWWNIHGR